ncbi:hypothetical protein RA210_U200021 [Rubrivivax sp. A210]|nr:hypothetical protein RA210_U200021 [Rubrivivax sp. A210]
MAATKRNTELCRKWLQPLIKICGFRTSSPVAVIDETHRHLLPRKLRCDAKIEEVGIDLLLHLSRGHYSPVRIARFHRPSRETTD